MSGIDLSFANKADLVAGKVPSSQLPSYVDDVLEYANLAAFPATGETGIIYVAIDTNKTYRWSGSSYIEIVTAETATTMGALINSSDAATPNDTDLVATAEAAGLLKKISWTNVKAFLKTYFDTLYSKVGAWSGSGTTGPANTLAGFDASGLPTDYSLDVDHTALTSLAWETSGHTGTANKLAGFNGSGVATEVSTITDTRITKRVVSVTQSATPAINVDNGDIFQITGLSQAITSFFTNLTGTPVEGDLIMIQITDDGTPRAITWGPAFASSTVSLPTTTVASTMLRVILQWDGSLTKYVCVASV